MHLHVGPEHGVGPDAGPGTDPAVVADDGGADHLGIGGDLGPVAILSEIPSLKPEHRDKVLELSRSHSSRFEALLEAGIKDGSIAPCDVRMTGNSIMGSINWIPKWFHGDADMAAKILSEFPTILCCGLRPTKSSNAS